jgi:excisionase family DNA binding protein
MGKKLRQSHKQVASGPDVAVAASPATIGSSQEIRLAPDAARLSDPRRAYTIKETARILSISRSTIYKLINNKSLKKIKACRPLITRDSIEDLLAGKGE